MGKLNTDGTPMNPYHYVRLCISGKWKMTILHHIHYYGSIRFNQTLRALPVSEKVLSQQLKELAEVGIVIRHVYETMPPKVEYVLTESGKELIEAIDLLYIWSIKEMKRQEIEIDPDAFVVHQTDRFAEALEGVVNPEEYIARAKQAMKIHEFVLNSQQKEKSNKD